jgi:hypothetical protein
MNTKTVWLFSILLLSELEFADAQAVKTSSGIRLNWEDTSNNEKGFRIYRVMPKGKTKIAEVGANITSYTDKSALSNACYVVTAFNSAGESDPSNVACVTDSFAGRLCGIELSPRGLKLLAEVEQAFKKQVRDRWDKDMNRQAAAWITADGTPTIRCHVARRDLNEEIIVHELCHLKFRAAGFPTIKFDGIEPNVSQWIDEKLYDTVQHWVMYSYLRKLGYLPEAAAKREIERAIAAGRFTDEPLPPSEIIFRYMRAALESSDSLLIDRLSEWYLRRGWDAQLNKARRAVQLIQSANPTTGEKAVQALIEAANVVFDPYLRFELERWEATESGSVAHRQVVIRALSRSAK